MKRLSSLDTQFLAAEGQNFGSQYCGLLMFDTTAHPIDKAVLLDRLEHVVRTCPPMRWTVVDVPLGLDYPVFVEGEVDLDAHVTESTLTGAGELASLAVEVGQFLATRLDRSRPLWRLHVFHGIPGRTAVALMLHHAVADGISATNILAALVDGPAPTASAEDRDRPSRVELALSGLATLPARWLRAVRATPQTLGDLDLVPPLRSLPGVQSLASRWRGDESPRLDAPRTRFSTKLSPGLSVAFGTLPFDVIKAVKNEFGFTVNDVVIALCAGALRRRMLSTGDLPDEPLVAYLPVSTRPAESVAQYGNSIGSIIAPIPTHLPDLRARLDFARSAMQAAKSRTQKASPTLMADVNDPIPSPIFGFAARGLMRLISSRLDRPPVNLVISNVAGPPTQLTLAGAPLVATYPLSVVFDSFALNITVVSYQNGLDIGIVGDAVALPDGWNLIDDFDTELAELAALATPRKESTMTTELTVATRRQAADSVVTLELVHPTGESLPDWEPGAHVDLILGDGLVRQYSLCGDPRNSDTWQIGVLLDPKSRGGSQHVHERLHEGTSVTVAGPRNHFELVESPRYLFIAGGIGITPIMPMVAAAERAGADWSLLYLGRSRTTMAFAADLQELYGDRVTIWADDERGAMFDLESTLREPQTGQLVYCCGPGPLMDVVEKFSIHWPEGSLHLERFAAKAPAVSDKGLDSFQVVCQQSGVCVDVEPGVSMLEALEDADVPIMSSCLEGICGTCMTDVVEGVPDHRDSILTAAERTSGKLILPCVSRSCTPKLVLDI